jgi:ABC-type transport system involved in multi-copper enzyme maturation permease subunit
MMFKSFRTLFQWEIERYLSLPVFSFLIASAIIVVLTYRNSSATPFDHNILNFYACSGNLFLLMTIVGTALFSHSFAGSVGKGEMKLLLSYPIKRWQIFISKLLAIFLPIFLVYSAVFSINLYLNLLSPFEPSFYLSLFSFLLQLLIICSVSITISLIIKNEIMTIMSSILLIFGLDKIVSTTNCYSAQGRLMFLYQYFGERIYGFKPFGDNFLVTSSDVLIAVSVPIIIFSLLMIVSFVYFIHMELD